MGEYIADSWTVSQWEAEHNHDFEWHAEVLDGNRLVAMRRLANTWEWNEGHGNGGENPHRHPEGWVPVYRDSRDPEFVMLVLHGPSTHKWYVVKADPQHVSAKEMNRLTGRVIPKRSQKNPNGEGSYEIPWLWLEPLEACAESYIDADEAVQAAKTWAAELKQAWDLELEGTGWTTELLVEPERMQMLRRAVEDEGEALLDEVLDQLVREEELSEVQ